MGQAVRRQSAITEAANLLATLVGAGLRTICFVKVRAVRRGTTAVIYICHFGTVVRNP
eukprot:SAG11_NODE_7977_length_1074_cov_3.987692_1_plen_58_part_00